MKRSLVVLSLLLASSTAFAADMPNMVGTWKPVGGNQATALFLPSHDLKAKFQKPIVSSKELGWTFRIDSQDGPVFAGVALGPEGREKPIAGAFRPDGKHFVYATDNGSGDGEITGDTFNVCWTVSSEGFVAASCASYGK